MPLKYILLYLVFAAGGSFLWVYIIPAIQGRLSKHKYGKELSDPFIAEVLYQGKAVAVLSERIITEMFWRSYRIEPKSEDCMKIIESNKLWSECSFNFRDPKTGDICSSGFVGGSEPFIQGGRILLRALYFGGHDSS